MKIDSRLEPDVARKPLHTFRHQALAALAATTLASQAFAQTPAGPPVGPDLSKVEVKTTDLGKNTYMLEGAGGNVTIAVGGDGIVMVDGQFAPMHDKLKAAIETQSKLPIKYLVNTHYHRDHVGGNEGFTKDGATVVAHANVRTRLANGATMIVPEAKIPPVVEGALPKLTYSDTLILNVKGRTARLVHPAGAHTDGDTYVYFGDANVLATGDTVAMGRYPNIDFNNGGNIKGMIKAADAYLRMTNAKTKIVPGHGPLANREQLKEYRVMLVTVRDRMAKLIKEGKSEADVLAAKPFADFDTKLGMNDQASANWIRVVYNSLKK